MGFKVRSREQANHFTEADGRQQYADPFNRKSVRSVLKSWDDSRKLGKHPLAQLDIVEARRRDAGYADTPTGRGVALRDVLREAIETLKPEAGKCDYAEKRWRPYIIIEEQYIEGRYPNYLAQQLGVQRSTYNHEQARAVDLLADILRRQEESRSISRSVIASVIPRIQLSRHNGHHVPFLAPPHPPYNLVGRDDLVRELKQGLLGGSALALSALNGLPGTGKTALAIELANDPQVLEYFRDGVLWAGLGRQPDVSTLLGTWSTALGIPSHEIAKLTSIEDKARAIHASIGMRRILLVIDDAWQMGMALAFKVGGPNCAHLLTTRIPEVALEFCDGKAMVVRELDEANGLTLLARLAPRAVEARPDEARALVQAVGGLPLALILMGKYLRKETHTDQPRRLDGAIDRLHQVETRMQLAQPRSALERCPDLPAKVPLSLLTVIGISDEALDERSRRALYALSVFPPKPNCFSEEAALAVSAAPVETLDTLTDRGLLESNGPGRYTLHQSIADYASMKLADEAVYERMTAFYTHYVETGEKDYDALNLETDNTLAAFQAAFERGMWAQLMRGASAFYHFLETKGLYESAETLMTWAAHAARSVGDTVGLATVLHSLGRTARKRGDYARAEGYLLEGLIRVREIGDYERISALLQSLGAVAASHGDYVKAETYLQEGLILARRLQDRQRISHLLDNLGGVALARANYAQAEAYLQEGLALARQIGYHSRIGFMLMNMGEIAINRGDYTRAEECLLEGLGLAHEIGHRESISFLLVNLGIVAGKRGDWAQAEAYFLEGLALAREIGHPENISRLLANLGAMASECGNYTEAEAYLQEGLTLARQIGYRLIISTLLQSLGVVAAARLDYAPAEAYLQEGLALAREIECSWLVSSILNEWGDLYLRRQELNLALAAFREALEIAQDVDMQEWIGVAFYGLARVAAAQGNTSDAHRQGREGLTVLEGIGHYKAARIVQWLATLPAIDLLENHQP